MPISGWLCVACGGRQVPLDHFATTKCGDTVHPDFANAVLKSSTEHNERRGGTPGVSVTQGLGCPRRAAIELSVPYYLDPLTMNAPETGTAWHAHLERASVDPKNTEVELAGVIAGIKVTGRCDRLRPPDTIEDAKHVNDFRRKYLKTMAPDNHRAQLSIYAELVEQTFGWRPTRGVIWYHFTMSGPDAFLPTKVDLLPIADALQLKPQLGKYSVLELFQQADSFFSGAVKWEDLPLAGESQMFGDKSLCTYCSVREVCWTQARGAPF